MTIKLSLILLLTTIIILSSFTACFNSKQNNTLSIYYYYDHSASDSHVLKKQIARFKELHPEISITMETGFGSPYHDKLHLMTKTGLTHDLIYLWPGKRTGYVTAKGLVKDLRPWIRGHEKEFKPIALTPQGPNGEIFELPDSIDVCHIIYTNTRLLNELGLTYPATFEEFVEQAPIIKAAGLTPISIANDEGWQIQSSLLSTLTERAAGNEWWNKVVTGSGASFSDPEFIRALNYIKILYDKGMFKQQINQVNSFEALNEFIEEKSVYFIDGIWRTPELVKLLTDKQKTYIAFNTFPDINDQKGTSGSTSVVPGTGFAMNARLNNKKADTAWKWIWFFSGPEGSKININTALYPAYIVHQMEIDDPFIRNLVDFAENIHFRPLVIDNYMDREGVKNVLQPDIKKMMSGHLTPEQVGQNYENWVQNFDSNRQR